SRPARDAPLDESREGGVTSPEFLPLSCGRTFLFGITRPTNMNKGGEIQCARKMISSSAGEKFPRFLASRSQRSSGCMFTADCRRRASGTSSLPIGRRWRPPCAIGDGREDERARRGAGDKRNAN